MITTFHLVRTNSSRLPNKCLLKFGENTVLEHSVIKAKKAGFNPVICTSLNNADDVIVKIAKKNKIKYFRGSLENKMKRIIDCASYFNFKECHLIDVDDPFYDPNQIKESMNLLKMKKLAIVLNSRNSAKGLASVGISINLEYLIEYFKNKRIPKYEMIESFFKKNNKKVARLPSKVYFEINSRLTLDYFEDYIFLSSLSLILGQYSSRYKIEKFLNQFKGFNKINLKLNNVWKKRQKKIIQYEKRFI